MKLNNVIIRDVKSLISIRLVIRVIGWYASYMLLQQTIYPLGGGGSMLLECLRNYHLYDIA